MASSLMVLSPRSCVLTRVQLAPSSDDRNRPPPVPAKRSVPLTVIPPMPSPVLPVLKSAALTSVQVVPLSVERPIPNPIIAKRFDPLTANTGISSPFTSLACTHCARGESAGAKASAAKTASAMRRLGSMIVLSEAAHEAKSARRACYVCHPRESGDPGPLQHHLDSRFRGNDRKRFRPTEL